MVTVSEDDAAFATRVVGRHHGVADQVVPLPGGVNRVLRATGPGTDWVVRFPVDRRRPDEFPVEAWAAHAAREQGIDTPRVVATGHLDGRPYLIAEYVSPYGEPNITQLWRWLGHYAATLADVPLEQAPDGLFSRFGRDLPSAWRSHVRYNLDALGEQDQLLADGVYRRGDLEALRSLLEPLEHTDFPFGLAHGDLAPRNLIPQGTSSPPVLIDWGTATSGPAPWVDLQRVYEWVVCDRAVSHEALRACAAAAGLPLGGQVTTVLTQLTLLRFLDLPRWARDRRPDLYDHHRHFSRRGLRTILEALEGQTVPSPR